MKKKLILVILLSVIFLAVAYGNAAANIAYIIKEEHAVIDDGAGGENLWVKVYLENYDDVPTPAATGAQINMHMWYSNTSRDDITVNDAGITIGGVGPHGKALIYNKMIPLAETLFNKKYNLTVIIGPSYAPLGFVSEVIDLQKPAESTSNKVNSIEQKLNSIFKTLLLRNR